MGKNINENISKDLSRKYSQKFLDNSETVTDENDREILKERYISPENRQKTTDNLRLK